MDLIANNYDPSNKDETDQEKVEDMILEINRNLQKTNGVLTSEQQLKIQNYVSRAEMAKRTYK